MPSRRVFSVVRDDRGRPVGDGPVTPTSDLRAEHAEPSSPPAPDRAFGDDDSFVSVAVRDEVISMTNRPSAVTASKPEW
jgi:hypothetical protein